MSLTAFILSFAILLLSSCADRQRKDQLDTREASLNQKEQELLLMEKDLQLKEQKLLEMQVRFDSLQRKDTFQISDTSRTTDTARVIDTTAIIPSVAGLWSVKMTCIETTCSVSAVGDTKIEQWEISYHNDHLVARVMTQDQLTRIYTGTINQKTIELADNIDKTSSQAATRIVIRLRMIDDSNMEGQRELIREDCKVIYSLQMQKQ